MSQLRSIAPLFACILAFVPAVVITSGDGSGNVTPPSDDPGFANVGVKGDSAVYLGGGWALTAKHSGAGDVTLGGVRYSLVPDSAIQIPTDETTLSDLSLFRLQPLPPLPALTIAEAPASVGEAVVMIGNGNNRASAKTYWDASWNEVAAGEPFFHAGFLYGSGRTIRWGSNAVSRIGLSLSGPGSLSREFEMQFDDLPDEAQAVNGDSGGAIFAKRGGQWELLGIMNFVSHVGGAPSASAVFGARSYAMDLSFYRDRILEHTGVPGAAASVPAAPFGGTPLVAPLLGGAGVAALRWRERTVLPRS